MCGGLAKGYVLAWDVAAGYALCDMEITLCNCTYVQFFL